MISNIAENIRKLLDELPPGVSVVAVTKTRTEEEILEAYRAGLRIFGENRVQEMIAKKPLLPDDISWHFIGRLQSNKVKQTVAAASVIESVDSLRLLRLIDASALAQGKCTECLLQVHIAAEETKSGFSLEDMEETDWRQVSDSLKAARICGVMGMRRIREKYFAGSSHFREISMGMSGDWPLAVSEGSTMIRIGTLIFGERNN